MLHEQAALLHLDAFVQSFFGIAVEHGTACARMGPVSTPASTGVHGRAGNLHAVGRAITRTPCAPGKEKTQQGGVGVDNAVAEALDQLRIHDEAGGLTM